MKKNWKRDFKRINLETKMAQSRVLREIGLRYRTMQLIGMMGWLAFFLALALVLFTSFGCARPAQIGPTGPAGAVGAAGNSGAVGEKGDAGAAGSPGTDITPIQLCPDVVPTYSSIFPEYVLCIDDHLYGTYNGNTAYQYFSELPDGAYSSNGQGAACTFNIVGCSVTY